MQAYKYFSDFRTDLAVNRCLGASIIVFAMSALLERYFATETS
jgi:hypothetical protein